MNQLKREIPKANWDSEKHRLQIKWSGGAHPYIQHVGCGHADIYQAVIVARAQPVISKRLRCRGL